MKGGPKCNVSESCLLVGVTLDSFIGFSHIMIVHDSPLGMFVFTDPRGLKTDKDGVWVLTA